MTNLTREMTRHKFSQTVGELQGELQHPPESLRIGKKCWLFEQFADVPTMIPDGYVLDKDVTAERWVLYAPVR